MNEPLVRVSYVYLFQHPDGTHKIGSSWQPEERMRRVGRQMQGNPALKLVSVWPLPSEGDSLRVERAAHRKLHKHLICEEWFDVGAAKARQVIGAMIKAHEQGRLYIASPLSKPKMTRRRAEIKAYKLFNASCRASDPARSRSLRREAVALATEWNVS